MPTWPLGMSLKCSYSYDFCTQVNLFYSINRNQTLNSNGEQSEQYDMELTHLSSATTCAFVK